MKISARADRAVPKELHDEVEKLGENVRDYDAVHEFRGRRETAGDNVASSRAGARADRDCPGCEFLGDIRVGWVMPRPDRGGAFYGLWRYGDGGGKVGVWAALGGCGMMGGMGVMVWWRGSAGG
jgi:hypothetical protein